MIHSLDSLHSQWHNGFVRKIVLFTLLLPLFLLIWSQKSLAVEIINLFPGWNTIRWPSISGKQASNMPPECKAIAEKNKFGSLYVKGSRGKNFPLVNGKDYSLLCGVPISWNLTPPTPTPDPRYTYYLIPPSGPAPVDLENNFNLDVFFNSNGISTNAFQITFKYDPGKILCTGASVVNSTNLYTTCNNNPSNPYILIRTQTSATAKNYGNEKIGTFGFRFPIGSNFANLDFDTVNTYFKDGNGVHQNLQLPGNYTYTVSPNVTIPPSPTPTITSTPGPTSTPAPTPTPCAGGSTYDGNPVRNYIHYANAGTDYNAQRPNGAPWGVIGIFPWSEIHVGENQFNWAPIDNYIQTALCTNKSVLIKILSYESDVPTWPEWDFTSPYQCPCPSGASCVLVEPEDPSVATQVYHLYSDMTPNWLKSRIGSIYVPLAGQDLNGNGTYEPSTDIKRCRPRVPGGSSAPLPNFCYSVAAIPNYDHSQYQTALRNLINAFGARYKNDNRVAGILFGIGLDNEFGEWTKGAWGDCYIKAETSKLGLFDQNRYLNAFVKSGTGNDYTDWYADAFYPKQVFHGVTSTGKDRMPTMFAQGHTNLGIHQASLSPDHNWFMYYGKGILELAIQARDLGFPIMFENALSITRDAPWQTTQQQMYLEMLAMLHTFPTYFDFVQALCFSFPEQCKWAKQYYSRTPSNTNDIWISFQETIYPPSHGYSGWLGDYEYGLRRVSAKGTTIWRQSFNDPDGGGQMAGHPEPGLYQIFNSWSVANAYTGQARKLPVNETMILAPFTTPSVWKGISGSGPFNYTVRITYIDNGSGNIRVEVGSDTDGYDSQEWARTNSNSWMTKQLTFSGKKAMNIKITPTSGDPLYLHMVRVSLPGSTAVDISSNHVCSSCP